MNSLTDITTSTKVLQIDFEVVFFTFLIFHYMIALYRWKLCSIVYSHVKCDMQPITHTPTALLTILISPISHQHKCEHKYSTIQYNDNLYAVQSNSNKFCDTRKESLTLLLQTSEYTLYEGQLTK